MLKIKTPHSEINKQILEKENQIRQLQREIGQLLIRLNCTSHTVENYQDWGETR